MSVHLAASQHPGALIDAAGRYLDWGVVQISLANLLVIIAMIALFVIALLVPFPGGRSADAEDSDDRG